MELSDKAYSSLLLLKRASFLMGNFPEDAEEKDILKVCKELVKYLKD